LQAFLDVSQLLAVLLLNFLDMFPFGSELLDFVKFLLSLFYLPLFFFRINFNFVLLLIYVADWLFNTTSNKVVKQRVLSHLVLLDDAGP